MVERVDRKYVVLKLDMLAWVWPKTKADKSLKSTSVTFFRA